MQSNNNLTTGIINQLSTYYEKNPLKVILFAGLIIRLLAAIFSRGFGWIDDQFLVIEIAQSWVDGTDYYKWLPDTPGNDGPKGFSFFYTGLHFVFFKLLEFVGIIDPQTKMFFVRLIHGLWSLLIIKFGYDLTLHFSNKKTANQVGWILALFWMFPFLSVRNLVEFVCIPFLMLGTLLATKSEDKFSVGRWIWIGVLFGMAFNIRYQTGLFTAGVGLVIFLERKWKQAVILSVGVLMAITVIQGGIDYFIWGKPFTQLISYITYNASSAGQYTVGPWYHYIIFLLGMMIPPVSIFLFFGYLRSYRQLAIIFIPVLLFFVFHSFYPNKQERFITTIVPFLFISGVIGWKLIEESILNPSFMRKLIKGSWVFFWVVNLLAIFPVSIMYSKMARVESMTYLSKYKNLDYFIIEDDNKDVLRFPPQFYLGQWVHYEAFMKKDDFGKFAKKKDWSKLKNQPDFVLFFQPDDINERVSRMKTIVPDLLPETIIEPGMMDKVLHWLNPINDNQNIYIYRNKALIPEKIIQQ